MGNCRKCILWPTLFLSMMSKLCGLLPTHVDTCPHLLSSCQYLVIHDLCIDQHNKALWHIQKFFITHHANNWKCFINDFVLIISHCPPLTPIVLMVQLKMFIPYHIMSKYPFTKWPPHTFLYPFYSHPIHWIDIFWWLIVWNWIQQMQLSL